MSAETDGLPVAVCVTGDWAGHGDAAGTAIDCPTCGADVGQRTDPADLDRGDRVAVFQDQAGAGPEVTVRGTVETTKTEAGRYAVTVRDDDGEGWTCWQESGRAFYRVAKNELDADRPNAGRLIPRDCGDPAAEFRGQLERLIREARHNERQPVDDDELGAALDAEAGRLLDAMGGGRPTLHLFGGGRHTASLAVVARSESEAKGKLHDTHHQHTTARYLGTADEVADRLDGATALSHIDADPDPLACESCDWTGDGEPYCPECGADVQGVGG